MSSPASVPTTSTPTWREVLDLAADLEHLPRRAHALRIRERFGVSPTRYHAWLQTAIERPEARAHAPAIVGRLLRLRDERRRLRALPTSPRCPDRPDARQRTLDLARPHAKEVTTVDQLSFPRSADPAALREAAERATAAAGEVHKLLGMGQADAAADPAWRERVDAAITRLATTQDEDGHPVRFTAEDVRAIAGDPPGHPNAMGARFNAAARRGEIRKVDYRLATRASLHRHPIALWQGAQPRRAETEEVA